MNEMQKQKYLVRTDRNGTKYYAGEVNCDRCGGAGGSDAWSYTGWTCYKCGGSGKMQSSWKEYTPEYEQKLLERRLKRRQKWEQEHAEEIAKAEAERKAKEEAKRKAEEERLAQRAISQHIGQIGDKIEIDVTLDHSAWFEIPSFAGYGSDTMHIYTFMDDKGNALIWKTQKGLMFEKGTRVHLTGTIKDHGEYDHQRQTILTRCKVREA